MVNGVFGAHGVHVQLHVEEEPMTGTDNATIHQLKMEAWIAQALVMKVHFAMIMTVQVSNLLKRLQKYINDKIIFFSTRFLNCSNSK